MSGSQNYRLIKCEACNEWTCVTEEFPKSIGFKRATAHEQMKPYLSCVKCGGEIFQRNGQWVAKYPDRLKKSWLVDHFMNPNLNLTKVMLRWDEEQKEGKIGEFYNGVLGLPYISAEDRLKESDVYACCGGDVMRTDMSLRETAMGCDIGKNYHTVVIGERVDSKRAKVIYLCRVKGFDALHDLAQKYNVKSAVIDIRPYEEEFTKFQAAETYRVYGAEYKDKQSTFSRIDEKSGIYSLLRTQIFDKTHLWIKNNEVELPRRCAEVEEYAKQMCNSAKILEEDEETGDRVYRYVKLGDDHYRSAMNYFYMALQSLTHYQGLCSAGASKGEIAKDYNPLSFGLN